MANVSVKSYPCQQYEDVVHPEPMKDQHLRHDTSSNQHSGDPQHHPCHNTESIASVGVLWQVSRRRFVRDSSGFRKISNCRHRDRYVVESSSPGATACKKGTKDTQERPRDKRGSQKTCMTAETCTVVVRSRPGQVHAACKESLGKRVLVHSAPLYPL